MPDQEPGHLRLEREWVREEARVQLFGGAPRAVTLGRFVLRRRLGVGAMATVYAAHDPTLEREVAIKVVHASVRATTDSPLLREARTLAKLTHPHILPVFEVCSEGDVVWLVSEIALGGDLREWMKSPHPEAATLDLLERVGDALATAHSVGVVHQDVKPENVVVDVSGRPRLCDFGLASLGPRIGDSTALPGTPRYSAPEKLRGDRGDAASDQFGFALMAIEAITGQFPFVGATPEELATSIRRGPSFPRGRTREQVATLAVLSRAVSFSASDRFSSMMELLVALRAARLPSRPRAAWFAIAGAIGLSLLTLGIIALAQRTNNRPRRSDPSEPPSADPTRAHPTEASSADQDEAAVAREAIVFTRAGQWTECARWLSVRATSKDLLLMWIGCAEYSADPTALDEACVAWGDRIDLTKEAPTPEVCTAVVVAARDSYRRGDYVACAERILGAPPTRYGTVQLTRCTSKLSGTRFQKNVCEYQQSMEPPQKRVSCDSILDLQ